MNRTLAAVLTAAALLWVVTLAAAPALLHSPAFATPAGFVYLGASRVCHQRVDRSFRLAGTQMPVCARCASLYFAASVGALGAWLGRRLHPRLAPRTILFVAALPTAITWTLEHLAGVPFSNVMRALAALPLGLSAGWLVVGMLRYDSRLDGEQILDS